MLYLEDEDSTSHILGNYMIIRMLLATRSWYKVYILLYVTDEYAFPTLPLPPTQKGASVLVDVLSGGWIGCANIAGSQVSAANSEKHMTWLCP